MTKTTDEQKLQIKSLYKGLDGPNCNEIGRMFGITGGAVIGLLKRRGVKIENNQSKLQRKYDINETYFIKIDTEEKAYFLGLLYADGCNFKKNRVVTLGLSELDKDIIEKLRDVLYFNKDKPLQFIKGKSKKNCNSISLTICSIKICNQLENLGCVPQKSLILKFPTEEQVPNYLIRHFIRGYFDGDGCISYNKNKKKCVMTFTGSTRFINTTKDILKKKIDINCNISCRHENNQNCSTIFIGGHLKIIKLLRWMYDDACIFLARKHNIYKEFLGDYITNNSGGQSHYIRLFDNLMRIDYTKI